MQNKNTRRGFTQINKHVVICPPCGESTLKGGKGVVNKATLLVNPPLALCATSPTLGGKSTAHGFTARSVTPQGRYAGYSGRSGFTLIELLVVVLIIGILAAVAVPQYQKAVLRSRFAALKPIAKAVKDAQEIYFEANGDYASSSKLDQLDISIPEGTDIQLSSTDTHEYVSVGSTKLDNRYRIYFNHSENFAGNVYCEALTKDDPLCIANGGQTGGPTHGNYTLYLLSGNSAGSFPYTLQSSSGREYIYSNGSNNVLASNQGYYYSIFQCLNNTCTARAGNESYCVAPPCPNPSWGTYQQLCEKYSFLDVCNKI